MTKLVYVMHPFGGDLSNLDKVDAWCAFLSAHFDALFIAPWVPMCRHWENNGISLDRGMRLDFLAIERCDMSIAVGGRMSPGMLHEASHCDSLKKYFLNASRFETPNQMLDDEDAMRLVESVFGRAP